MWAAPRWDGACCGTPGNVKGAGSRRYERVRAFYFNLAEGLTFCSCSARALPFIFIGGGSGKRIMRLACRGFLLMGLEGAGGSCGRWRGCGMPRGCRRAPLATSCCGMLPGEVLHPRTALCYVRALLPAPLQVEKG